MKVVQNMIKCNMIKCFFFLLLLCACGTDNNGLRNIAFENLVGVPSGCDYIVDYPQEMYVIDSLLILCDPRLSKGVVEVYDINTGDFIQAPFKRGRGDFEFMSPYFLGFSNGYDSLYIYDVMQCKLIASKISLHRDSLIINSYNQYESDRKDIVSTKLAKLDNGYIVSLPYFAKDSMFVLFDSKMQFKQKFGNLPVEWKITDEIKLYNTFVGDLKAHGNKVIYASGRLPYVVCYDVADDGTIVKCWEVMLDEYSIYFEGDKLRFSNDNPQTFMSIHPTSDKIFVVYNGYTTDDWAHDIDKSVEYKIIAIDYEGQVVGAYELDYPIIKLSVSPNGKDMFVFTGVDERMDIVKYTIK